MKQNKRGVSEVVTTVLIVMLVVAAIGVIAGFVVPFVKNSLQKSTECTDYKGFYTFDESLESSSFKSNCNAGNNYTFSIKAGSDNNTAVNVAGIKLIFIRPDGTTNSTEIKNGFLSGTGGIRMFDNGTTNLMLPGSSGIRSYNYSSEETFESAEVYPILKSGRICADIKESIKIKPC